MDKFKGRKDKKKKKRESRVSGGNSLDETGERETKTKSVPLQRSSDLESECTGEQSAVRRAT